MIQRFADGGILMAVPFAILIVFVGLRFYAAARKKLVKVFGEKNYAYLSQGVSVAKRRWKLLLQSVVVAVMLVALARPQGGEREVEVVSEGVEIMFVVDVSESMLAEDVRPSRLAQAKAELSKLVDLLPGHKIGIVAFAGSATLLSPLSTDPGALKMYIDSLSPIAVSAQGTVFRSALEEAADAFRRGGAGEAPGAAVTRVILLASDGEDHEPGALEAAKKLVEQGIRIFALVYGTEKGGPIPVRDTSGTLTGYRKDVGGQTVLTTVKGEALKAIAEAGKGAFHFASFGGSHLRDIVEDIDKLEKTQFDSKSQKQYEERFQIFLLAAILFGLLELLLGQKKGGKTRWRGRFELSRN